MIKMILSKLEEWAELKIIKRLMIFSIILLAIIFPIMNIFFILSGYPVSFLESQLSFNGQILKAHYLITNIDLYRIAQILDFGYMISYGSLIFTLALIACRKFKTESSWAKMGCIISILGFLAACCDAGENAFILAMLSEPFSFPDILAIIHSFFALIKWILLPICILWILIAFIVSFMKKYSI